MVWLQVYTDFLCLFLGDFLPQAAFVSLQMGGKPRWVAQIGALGQTHIFRNLGGVCTMGRNVWTLVLGQHFFRGLNETVIL